MNGNRDAGGSGGQGFAADAAGARWTYAGALTFAEAGSVLTAASALALPRDGLVVDCSGIGAFDSSAVAVLLALERRAAAEGRGIAFVGLSPRLEALAALYGVEEMLAG